MLLAPHYTGRTTGTQRGRSVDLLFGKLTHVFLISMLDAALLSWLALWWYRGSVRRLMAGRGSKSAAPAAMPSHQPDPSAGAAAPESLAFALFEPSRVPSPDSPRPSHDMRRLAIAYGVGAALYATVMTVLTLGGTSPAPPLVAWFGEAWMNAWPVVPTMILLFAVDRGARFRVAAWYLGIGPLAVLLITLIGQVLRGTLNTAPLTNVYWVLLGLLVTASAPLVLLLVTASRRVRAVTPLALSATLFFGFGSLLSTEALVRAFNVGPVQSLLLDLAALTSVGSVRHILFMLLSLPVGWLAWRSLRGLAVGYERKRFSDTQLMVDYWWFVASAVDMLTLSTPLGFGAIGGGLAAFGAYRLGVALTLRGRRRGPDVAARRLLLLRVFGYQARTEALFDRVAQQWRFHGPVQLIAGVDLAMRTADPGDILAFINGHLGERYVATPGEVTERLGRLDLARDPDDRFRVNEVYCLADTWRPTLEALLDMSDTVLMDLRSFGKLNAGCLFELEQLLRRVPSDKVVLVCDKTTDLTLLAEVLGEAWGGARREGRARGSGQLALVRVDGHSPRELRVLMERLMGIAGAPRLLAPAELPAVFA
jgi:hypothetical protein